MEKALILNLGNSSKGEAYAKEVKDLGYDPVLLQNECPESGFDEHVPCATIPVNVFDNRITENVGLIYIPQQDDVDQSALSSAANGLVQYVAGRSIDSPSRSRFQDLLVWSAAPFQVSSVFKLPNVSVRDAVPQLDQYGLEMLSAERDLAAANQNFNDCSTAAKNFADAGYTDEALMLADGCFNKKATLPNICLVQLAYEAGDATLARSMLAQLEKPVDAFELIHFAGTHQKLGDVDGALRLVDEVRTSETQASTQSIIEALSEYGFSDQLKTYLQELAEEKLSKERGSNRSAFEVAMFALKSKETRLAFEVLYVITDKLENCNDIYNECSPLGIEDGVETVLRITPSDFTNSEDKELARRVLLKLGKTYIEKLYDVPSNNEIVFFAEPMIALGFQDELVEFLETVMDKLEDKGGKRNIAYVAGYSYALLLKAGLTEQANDLLEDAPDHEVRSAGSTPRNVFSDFVRGAAQVWPQVELSDDVIKRDFALNYQLVSSCGGAAAGVLSDLRVPWMTEKDSAIDTARRKFVAELRKSCEEQAAVGK